MGAGDELVGQTLGPFRVDFKIGSGATGVVYRAQTIASGQAVALKVLHDNLGSITGLERRFKREARVLKKLSHPNIVEIADFGMERGRTYIAMELLVGETLEDRLERNPLTPAEALAVYVPILEALADAHEHEVVHRDLKPANVFISDGGGVKLLDFGLAKMLSIEDTTEEGTLTRKGRIVGTPAYMAPEQITGVFIDVRADVYALGVMLFELLADRRPFLYERRSELLRAHLLEPVPPIDGARPGLHVHPELVALLTRALAKDAAKRYPNAREMLTALRALPADSVRLDTSAARASQRQRTGPSSAVITAEERQAITESAGMAARTTDGDIAQGDSVPPPGHGDRGVNERDRPTEVPTPPRPAHAISTVALYGLALALLGAAAAIWVAFIGLT